MEIVDRTPFRNEGGIVDIFGRVQGTLKYGFSWYARLEAQNAVIAVLDKALGSSYILLRNITLPDTEIDLPMVLIGPAGLYLINVTSGRGVYQARDDEWGTIVGEKFVPAASNIVQRTVKLGRVLQIYLDRAGFKDQLIVEPILMAADPGMHIESVRPATRIVMSDALERFAISMNQARAAMHAKMIADIAQMIVNGPKPQANPSAETGLKAQETIPGGTLTAREPDPNLAFTADTLGFSFSDEGQDQNSGSAPASQNATLRAGAFSSPNDRLDALTNPDDRTQATSRPKNQLSENTGKPSSSVPKKKGLFGMSATQLFILVGVLLFWFCAMAGFAIYIYLNQ